VIRLSIFYFCFLLLPLDWPPPKSFLIFAILLFLLESLLFFGRILICLFVAF
jgi:hypothetical protein